MSSEFGRNSSIFGRTDLRKGVSEAKFDVEAAGDVKNSKISRKSAENHEKPKNVAKILFEKKFCSLIFFFDSESFETRFGDVLRVKNCAKTMEHGEKYDFLWSNTVFFTTQRIHFKSTWLLKKHAQNGR